MSTIMEKMDLRPADSRFHTRTGWLDSRHSFSFANHYDPDNTHHGILVVSNDDVIRPGTGFSTHPHRDMEIVTWVLEGELEHRDSQGHRGVIHRGLAQRMSAGTGIRHSEMNPSASHDARFVQMWVLPDTEGIDPGYEQLDISRELASGGLIPLASGGPGVSAIRLRQKDATLWVARLERGRSVFSPEAAYVHIFVAEGSLDLEGSGPMKQGDALRLTAAGSRRMTGGPEGAEALIWEMHRGGTF
jgi:redox-sensitive bicupin YhaK (pirin superfamily)